MLSICGCFSKCFSNPQADLEASPQANLQANPEAEPQANLQANPEAEPQANQADSEASSQSHVATSGYESLENSKSNLSCKNSEDEADQNAEEISPARPNANFRRNITLIYGNQNEINFPPLPRSVIANLPGQTADLEAPGATPLQADSRPLSASQPEGPLETGNLFFLRRLHGEEPSSSVRSYSHARQRSNTFQLSKNSNSVDISLPSAVKRVQRSPLALLPVLPPTATKADKERYQLWQDVLHCLKKDQVDGFLRIEYVTKDIVKVDFENSKYNKLPCYLNINTGEYAPEYEN